jgi:sugar phosphate isomerase/epimerase
MLIPSINTIGLPDWSLRQVVEFAHQQHVPFFEIRGLENTLDLLSLEDFSTDEGIQRSLQLLRDEEVRILSLDLSFRISEINAQMENEIRRYAQTADALGVPYLRFFPGGSLETAQERSEMTEKAVRLLEVMAPYRVTALVETHDSLMNAKVAAELVEKASQSAGVKFGVVWDVVHTVLVGGEAWQHSLALLKPYIGYLHIKDGIRSNGVLDYTLLFEGEMPMKELLLNLQQRPQQFIVSFEWEKLWHPELAPGETAFVDFLKKIRSLS